ncbi:MAG TPA: hypothetical protein VL856_20895 [Acidimicrobiia bacterium]|jgi:hypothetical protein|nr:hypothetical protein [Acidimicrobiia bacterium]
MSDVGPAEHSTRVQDAVAIVRRQAVCSVEEAFVLLHERATVSGVTMEQVIDAVIDGEVRFDPDAH